MPNINDPQALQWLYVTTRGPDEAETIARALVAERLVACANVLGEARSFYWWNGAVEGATETVLVLKTKRVLVDTVTQRIKALHSYDCPCVVALDIDGGNADFLKWIAKETR